MTARSEEDPTLVATCGPPGVGKTTVGEAVADRLDGVLYRTDIVRKELVAEPEYTDRETERVYEELLDRARRALGDGESVVLDATFSRREYRDRARRTAEVAAAEFRLVRVTAPQSVVEERIRGRTGDASDADVEVFRTKRERFEPVAAEHVVIDNSDGLEATRRQVEERF